MSTTKAYKNYHGSIEVDMEREILRGKILFIKDLVTYEASDLKSLQTEFEAAVDDYVETCAELGRDAQKPLSGTFNVRVDPELHMQASILAAQQGVSLNSLVGTALHVYVEANCKVKPSITVSHEHSLSVTVLERSSVVVSSARPTTWESVPIAGETHAHH